MGNGASELSPEELKELVSKSHLSEAEITQLKAKFDSHDTDKSGELDLAEFKNMFAWLANPKDPSILDRLFKLYDYDKSGKVSFQEVAVTLGLLSRGAPGEKISLLFQLFDEDRDDKLVIAEVTRLVTYIKAATAFLHQPQPGQEVSTETLLSLIDLNKDGNISRAEWTACVLRNPKLRALVLGDGA